MSYSAGSLPPGHPAYAQQQQQQQQQNQQFHHHHQQQQQQQPQHQPQQNVPPPQYSQMGYQGQQFHQQAFQMPQQQQQQAEYAFPSQQQSMGFDYGASFAQNGGQNQWAATPPSSSPFYDGGFGAVQGQMNHEQFGMPLPPSSSSPMTTPGVVANIWLQQLQQQPQGHYSISQSPQQHGAGYHLPSPQMPPQQQPQAIKQHMPQRSPSVSMPLQHQLQHQQFVGQPQQYGQSHHQQLRQSPVQPACMRHKPVPSPGMPSQKMLYQQQQHPHIPSPSIQQQGYIGSPSQVATQQVPTTQPSPSQVHPHIHQTVQQQQQQIPSQGGHVRPSPRLQQQQLRQQRPSPQIQARPSPKVQARPSPRVQARLSPQVQMRPSPQAPQVRPSPQATPTLAEPTPAPAPAPAPSPSPARTSVPVPVTVPAPPQEQPKPIELPQPQEQPQSHFEPVAPAPEQVQFVNLQDIQRMPMSVMPASAPAPVPAPVPAPAPPSMPDTNPPPMSNSVSSSTTTPSLQPAPVIKPSPSSTPHMSTIPSIKSDPSRVQKAQPKSASQSPAVSSSRLPSRSPAVSTKQTPLNTCFMMVTLAEEFIEKARAAVPAVAASLQPGQVDEYQKLIGTGLACLEGALQSQGLPPRQEARVRLRYAAVLQEETENIMEAETTLSKGITLCDKHRMIDLKYGMQYLMMKVLFRRHQKAALKALDQHIADCDAYQHVHWAYAFRLLKASFYMEAGSAADAASLENIRSIQTIASTRGDSAMCVYASLWEALILLKMSRGSPEMIQTCLAQASKYQFDPKVKIPQLELMYLLVDFLSSLHREKQDGVVERLRRLQKKIDECQHMATKTDFLLPVTKQPTSSQTIGDGFSFIVRPGGSGSDSDYLVMSFMTQMELTVLVFTMGGVVYLHKLTSTKASSADLWQQGLKILGYLDSHSSTLTSEASHPPLGEAVKQREWRASVRCYLNLLLGLLAASGCSWDAVKHHLAEAEAAESPSTTAGPISTLHLYLKGVYCQGVGDFDNALYYLQDEAFSLAVDMPKHSQRHLALLAAMNRLWIMQEPRYQDDRQTIDMINEMEPICRDHPNIEIRGAWSCVKATVVTNPPRQRNQRKEDAGRALGDVRASTNALATTIGLVIARDLLYNNLLGDQAWKCMQAAAHWANKSSNPLWQSVVDGILADFSDAKNEKENSKRYWDKGVYEAQVAFSHNFS